MGIYILIIKIRVNTFKFIMEKEGESHSNKRPNDNSGSDSDRNVGERNPPPNKKEKQMEKSGPKMENGEPTWDLGNNKKVRINKFKGNTYIDIREYYVDRNTDETKPGKKGISLNMDQFQQLRSIIEDVNHASS